MFCKVKRAFSAKFQALSFQEVGSIIGKRGDHIKTIRDGSGAKINISDGSCPERIVTITGSTDTINKAFVMICAKLQQVSFELVRFRYMPKVGYFWNGRNIALVTRVNFSAQKRMLNKHALTHSTP